MEMFSVRACDRIRTHSHSQRLRQHLHATDHPAQAISLPKTLVYSLSRSICAPRNRWHQLLIELGFLSLHYNWFLVAHTAGCVLMITLFGCGVEVISNTNKLRRCATGRRFARSYLRWRAAADSSWPRRVCIVSIMISMGSQS